MEGQTNVGNERGLPCGCCRRSHANQFGRDTQGQAPEFPMCIAHDDAALKLSTLFEHEPIIVVKDLQIVERV